MTALAPTLAVARPHRLERVRAAAPAVFAGSLAVVLVHLAVDAFAAGVRDDVVPALAALVAAAAFPRLRPAFRAWLASVAGALAVADFAFHLRHLRAVDGLSLEDATGGLVGAAGIVLVALAAAIALRPKARGRAHRWAARLAVPVATVATAFVVVVPLTYAIYTVHKQPTAVSASALGIPHRSVTLHTRDGRDLAAWWVPSRNGATIVLVHGSGGDRAGGIRSRALMLARAGFGVLLWDARGSGESSGRPENLGWTWHRDVAAAVDFLAARGVHRIGALGLSTGAETVLESTGRDPRIGAVVAEGAQARSGGEANLLRGSALKAFILPTIGLADLAYRAVTWLGPPPRLDREVARIAPRPIFLISSGHDYEQEMNRIYRRAAAGPVTLWEMPDAAHTGGLAAYPRAYPQRIDSFFERALLP